MTAVPEAMFPYVHVEVPEDQAELVSIELFELGAGGVEQRDGSTIVPSEHASSVTLVASFDTDEAAKSALHHLRERFATRVVHIKGTAWADAWKAYFKPTQVSERVWVTPSWAKAPAADGQVVVTIDPENAFGSGIHETTRLMLREVDRRVGPEETVLDVGCGSGILSIAAALLGANAVVAIDNDVDAVAVTNRNAARNHVSLISASATPIDQVLGAHTMVLANIQADVLLSMSDAICARLAPGGRVVLSGILVGQESEIQRAYAPLGLLRVEREGEWVAMVFDAEPR